jgi:hypothetical protein
MFKYNYLIYLDLHYNPDLGLSEVLRSRVGNLVRWAADDFVGHPFRYQTAPVEFAQYEEPETPLNLDKFVDSLELR